MDKMKKFALYLLLLIAFYIFSNFMINAFLKVSYIDMHGYRININAEQLNIDISEAKSSKRNGYIKGSLKNNTDANIENKYLKVTLLSKGRKTISEKYLKIDKMESKQVRQFEVKFEDDNVNTFEIDLVDEKPEKGDEDVIIVEDGKFIYIDVNRAKKIWEVLWNK